MFSRRLSWDVPPNPLSRLLARKHRSGEDVLDLTESNPTRAGFVYPGLILEDPRMMVYESAPLGLRGARELIGDPDQVILTSSTSEAYSWLFKLFCDPGDEVLVPRPSYPLFEYLASLECVRVRPYPLRYHEGWFIDQDAIEVNERTRAIVVVNPNNPTGSYVKAREVEYLRDLGLPIISDEVFSDYALIPDPLRSLANLPNTFCLNGLSKMIGLPQMKLAWIATRNRNALERLELIADTYLPVGAPVQYMLPKLLAIKPDIQRQIMERLRENLAMIPQARHVEGGWYAIIQIPRTRTEEQWALDLLERRNVLVQPGYFYDFDSEAFLILSLLTPTDTFREGLARILDESAVSSFSSEK